MIRYSKLTNEQQDKIIERYKLAIAIGATDVNHAAAIAAHDVLAWKGRKCKRVESQFNDTRHAPGACPKCDHEADAYAAALAVIVHNGYAEVSPSQSEKVYAREAG
ncbi:MAG: hypothetical protein GY896_22730 [Gammaproteobacteria bacterium]|nr:hypothetical protein [Gammaproteobacteria bacterium]